MSKELVPLLHVGHENYILTNKIVAILKAEAKSVKNLVLEAKQRDPSSVIDVTGKRRRGSVIALTGGRYVVSSLSCDALRKRLGDIRGKGDRSISEEQ